MNIYEEEVLVEDQEDFYLYHNLKKNFEQMIRNWYSFGHNRAILNCHSKKTSRIDKYFLFIPKVEYSGKTIDLL